MEKLGIQAVPLITQIINFLILLVILRAILYKPLLKMLEERKKRISQSLEDALKIGKELDEIEKKRQQLLKEATLKAQEIVEEATNNAKREAAEILENQKQKIQTEKERALAELDSHKAKLVADVKKEVLDLAIRINKKVLEEPFLTDEEHHKLIKRRLENLIRSQ